MTSAGRHAAFYRAALTGSAYRRIFVSGTADHVMPSVVWESAVDAEVTVLDRCPTPCLLTRRYARECGLAVRTVVGDIRDHRADGAYDAICTHSFVTWFPPASRPQLYASWAALLRPGGKLVTVNRLRPPAMEAGPTLYSARERDRFVSEVRRRALTLRDELDLDVEELASLAAEYGRQKSGFPLRDVDRFDARTGGRRIRGNDNQSWCRESR